MSSCLYVVCWLVTLLAVSDCCFLRYVYEILHRCSQPLLGIGHVAKIDTKRKEDGGSCHFYLSLLLITWLLLHVIDCDGVKNKAECS